MYAEIFAVTNLGWAVACAVACYKAYEAGKRKAVLACHEQPARALVEEVVAGIEADVEALLGTTEQLQHEALGREIDHLRSSMRDVTGKVMPEIYVEWCLSRLKELSRRKEDLEKACGFRVGSHYRKTISECAQAKVRALLAQNSEDDIRRAAWEGSTEYQQMMAEIADEVLDR